ncbi:hypothetical protein FO519_007554 [Halicephalobus sp. NKZ332]|nr:hypothetical protein FO519_007554 [Halicephalobus sp. NKZ332]
MADLRYLKLACLVFVGLLLQGISGTGLKRFEATLHFRELNHEALKQTPYSVEKFLEINEAILADKLKNIFSDPSITLKFFEIIESGEELNQPTISVRTVITTSALEDRDEFIKIFENKIPQNPGLYLFSVGELTENKIVDYSALDVFHKKYSSRAPGECLNRGFMLPNNTCVCQPYYYGSDCSSQTCLNSGIISQNFRCSCPPGFVGRHCEQLGCMSAYDSEFDFRTRSFVTVFNTKKGTSFFLSRVIQAINQVVPPRAGYYANYILSVYYQDSSSGPFFSYTYLTTNYTDFLNMLNTQVQIHDGGNNQPTLSAVNKALLTNNAIAPRSDVYIFVNSLLSDFDSSDPYMESSTTAESLLTRTLLNWGHSVYTVLAQNPLAPFNDSDSSVFTGFNNIAAVSNGEFIYVGNDTSSAGTAFQTVFRFNFMPETLDVRRGFDCSSAASVDIKAGPYDSGIFVYTTGPGISVKNGGNDVAANGTFGNFKVFLVGLNISSASLTIQGSGSGCSYRVFTSSSETVVLAYSRNYQLVDASSNYPTSAIATYPVARIISSVNQSSLIFKAVSLSDPSSDLFNGGGTVLGNSARSGCNFPLSFSAWQNCNAGVFASVLQYIEDDGGAESTVRVRPSVCYKPIPRDPTNTPLNCNGGTAFSNNTCACTPYHSGKYCEVVDCQNGGSVNIFPGNGLPSCYCPEGYSGDYCEKMICTTASSRPDTSRKTINVVFQATFSASYYKSQVSSAADTIANGVNIATLFDGFTLTTFFNSSIGTTGAKTQMFNNITGLTNAISAISGANSDDLQPQNVLEGLNSSLYATVSHPWQQVLFLIVDSAIGDTMLLDQVVGRAINLATPINVIVVKPYGMEGDSSVKCIDGDSTMAYQTLADSTGGIFINICSNPDAVGAFMNNYGSILYNFQPVLRQAVNCSSTVTTNIEANDGIQTRHVVFITNVETQFSFSLQDPSGNNVTSFVENIVPTGYVYTADSLTIRGNYSISISPGGNIPGGLQCLLLIGEPAGQSILAGFALNPSYDYNSLAAQFGQAQHPTIFMSTQLQSPPTVSINIGGKNVEYNSVAVARDPTTCQFDYYFNDVFSCPVIGAPITINARITTNDNISFSRALPSVCQGPAIGQCLNGGSVSLDLNFICTCPPAFEGQFCEIPICYNGGSLIQNQCQCPSGFIGKHCELIQCDSWNYMATHDTNIFAFDTIAFVVNTNLVSALSNSYLSTGITDFINNVNVKDHPKQFILTTFDDVGVRKVISTTDPRKFISVFQNTVSKNTGSNSLNTTVKSIDAIYETITLVTYKPAVFFVFSSTEPASPYSNIFITNALLGQGGIQVNHILSGQNVFPSYENYFYIVQTSIPTGGRILPVSTDQISNLVSSYLPRAIFENVIIEDQSFPNCLREQWVYFPVESRAQWITLTATGDKVNNVNYVEVYDAANQKISNLNDYITVNARGTISYTIPSTANVNFAGYWRMSAETISSTPCKVQITANTPLQMDIGFSMSQTDDFPHLVANTGKDGPKNDTKSRYVTVGVSNTLYQQYDAFLEYIKISLYDDIEIGSGILTIASPFLPRNGQSCAYQYVTPLLGIPQNGPQSLQPFKAQINGQDEKGQNFQQIRWFMPQKPACSSGIQPDEYGYCPCPPTYTGDYCTIPICQNGGTADVSVCQCPSGFYGDFCDQRVLSGNTTSCKSGTTDDDYDFNNDQNGFADDFKFYNDYE